MDKTFGRALERRAIGIILGKEPVEDEGAPRLTKEAGEGMPRIQGLEALDAEVPTYKRPRAPLGFRAMGLGPRIKRLEFEV